LLQHATKPAQDFQGALSEALGVGHIFTEMKAAEDVNTVRLYFVEDSRHTVESADKDLDLINYCLVDITAPAALAEATKIRDAIIDARDIFRPFAAK
jgi:hypothetical protein